MCIHNVLHAHDALSVLNILGYDHQLCAFSTYVIFELTYVGYLKKLLLITRI